MLEQILNKSVDELEISVRLAYLLDIAKIRTIRDLVQQHESDLLKFKNYCNKKRLKEIKEVLAVFGLTLGMKLE